MGMFPQPSYDLVEVSAAYTAKPGDVVLVTTGTNALTVTLPGVGTKGPVIVRKVDAAGTGTVKVVTADGSAINGASGATGVTAGAASSSSGAAFASDGSNWFTVG